jgi:hypothetical protein
VERVGVKEVWCGTKVERILAQYGMVSEFQLVSEMDNKQPSKKVGGSAGW